MMGLTKRQSKVLDFLRAYIAEHGYAPALAEIAGHLGNESSKSSAIEALLGLEERGFIRRIPYRARAIELIEPGTVTLSPQVDALVSRYAAETRASKGAAVNELLAQALGVR